MIGCGWSVSLRLQPSRIPDPSPLRLLHVHRISPPPPAPSFPISSKRRGTFAVEDRPPSEPNRTGGVGTYTNRSGIHRIAANPRVRVAILVGGWQSHRRRPPSVFHAPTNGVAQRTRTERNASRNRDTEAGTVASCACVVRACHRRTNATTCGVVEDERHVERHPHRPRGG